MLTSRSSRCGHGASVPSQMLLKEGRGRGEGGEWQSWCKMRTAVDKHSSTLLGQVTREGTAGLREPHVAYLRENSSSAARLSYNSLQCFLVNSLFFQRKTRFPPFWYSDVHTEYAACLLSVLATWLAEPDYIALSTAKYTQLINVTNMCVSSMFWVLSKVLGIKQWTRQRPCLHCKEFPTAMPCRAWRDPGPDSSDSALLTLYMQLLGLGHQGH